MSTRLRRRANLTWNPRGQAVNTVGDYRRRNRHTNPRHVAGTNLVGYVQGTTGAVTRTNSTGLTAYAAPGPGITTARQVVAAGLGTATSDRAGDYIDVPASPGQIMAASIHARRVAGSTTKSLRLFLEYRSNSAGLLTFQSAALGAIADTTVRRITCLTTAAPTGTTTLRVYMWAEGTGAGVAESVTVDYTAALIELANTVGPYFDGATATDAVLVRTHSWSGAVDASASLEASPYVDALAADGLTAVRPRQASSWKAPAASVTAVDVVALSSVYQWTDAGATVVRLGAPAGTVKTSVAASLTLETLTAAATGTLVVTARREASAGGSVTLAATLNGTAVAGTVFLTDAYVTYRWPLALAAGANVLLLTKNGNDPALISSADVIVGPEAGAYTGDRFDGDTPAPSATNVYRWAGTNAANAPDSLSEETTPSLTLTAVAEPANEPPRVTVTLTDLDPTAAVLQSATVYRVSPGGLRTPVRTADGGPLLLAAIAGGRSGLTYDYEAPLGQAQTYELDGYTAGPDLYAPQAVTLDSPDVWLVDPGVPGRSRRVKVVELGDRERDVNAGTFEVNARPDPIVRTDGKRKTPDTVLVLRTYTDLERTDLDALLDGAGTLLLNVPAGRRWGLVSEYVAIGRSKEGRTAALASWQRRLWTLPYRVVGRPIGGLRPQRTWNTSAAEVTSYKTLRAKYGTWRGSATSTSS